MRARRSALSIARQAKVRPGQVFIAVLGASNYTFAEATWTQALPDWTASHQRAFRFFGGRRGQRAASSGVKVLWNDNNESVPARWAAEHATRFSPQRSRSAMGGDRPAYRGGISSQTIVGILPTPWRRHALVIWISFLVLVGWSTHRSGPRPAVQAREAAPRSSRPHIPR